MYVCMYVYIYTYQAAHMYIYIYIYIIYMYIHIYLYYVYVWRRHGDNVVADGAANNAERQDSDCLNSSLKAP